MVFYCIFQVKKNDTDNMTLPVIRKDHAILYIDKV